MSRRRAGWWCAYRSVSCPNSPSPSAGAGSGPIISGSRTKGRQAVQLLTRHWIITDGRGARHSVEGEGVVGEQPVIAPGASYDYVSGCPLATPTGSMQGSYHMIGEDGAGVRRRYPEIRAARAGASARREAHPPAAERPARARRGGAASVVHPRRRRTGGDAGRGRPADPRARGYARRRAVPPHHQGARTDARGRGRARRAAPGVPPVRGSGARDAGGAIVQVADHRRAARPDREAG